MPPEGSTRAEKLPGCPSLDRESREAEVGLGPRTFRAVKTDCRQRYPTEIIRIVEVDSGKGKCERKPRILNRLQTVARVLTRSGLRPPLNLRFSRQTGYLWLRWQQFVMTMLSQSPCQLPARYRRFVTCFVADRFLQRNRFHSLATFVWEATALEALLGQAVNFTLFIAVDRKLQWLLALLECRHLHRCTSVTPVSRPESMWFPRGFLNSTYCKHVLVNDTFGNPTVYGSNLKRLQVNRCCKCVRKLRLHILVMSMHVRIGTIYSYTRYLISCRSCSESCNNALPALRKQLRSETFVTRTHTKSLVQQNMFLGFGYDHRTKLVNPEVGGNCIQALHLSRSLLLRRYQVLLHKNSPNCDINNIYCNQHNKNNQTSFRMSYTAVNTL
ncbi:hypothetical protein CLF_106519 [Clonorchis sinensis]|uniref:Uncharacterized protein n=1 Tax=Clonorchis sinensis TaxID=79923 RepID=G7YQ04_CLOSI|nr:hypothetical protein CLF_106519 [Clonorchis sinensis]